MTKPIISFAVLLISLVFVFFYTWPAYNLNVQRRGDIESLSKILNTSDEIKTLLEKTKKNLSTIDPAGLDRFGVFLPEKIDPIRFANNIQSLGRKNRLVLAGIKVEGSGEAGQGSSATKANGVAQSVVSAFSLGAKIKAAESAILQDASVTSVSAGSNYVATRASFTFDASYETFQLFLNDIEKSLGLINVTSLSFSPIERDASLKNSKTEQTPIYSYTMEIETYSLK